MLWEVDIHPADGQPDVLGRQAAASAAELGLAGDLRVAGAARLFDPRRAGSRASGADRPRIAGRRRGRADRGRAGRCGDGATAGSSSSAANTEDASRPWHKHCWTSQQWHPGPRAAQARRDGPGGPERAVGHRRFRHPRRGGPHAEEILDRRPARRPAGRLRLEGPGQRRHRAGGRRAAGLRAARSGLALRVPAPAACPSGRWTTPPWSG